MGKDKLILSKKSFFFLKEHCLNFCGDRSEN